MSPRSIGDKQARRTVSIVILRSLTTLFYFVFFLFALALYASVPESSADSQLNNNPTGTQRAGIWQPSLGQSQHVGSSSGWIVYSNRDGGYSFAYPMTWTVQEEEHGSLAIIPPQGDRLDWITLSYSNFERGEENSLLEWAKAVHLLDLGPASSEEFTDISPVTTNIPGISLVYFRDTSPVPYVGYLIEHGDLVWRFSTYSDSREVADTLDSIVKSISFSTEAPLNLSELLPTDRLPPVRTVKAWQAQEEIDREVLRLLNLRAATGSVPAEELTSASPELRAELERTLEVYDDELQEIDRQRLQATLQLSSTITNPTESEYAENEEQYNKSLDLNGEEPNPNSTIPDGTSFSAEDSEPAANEKWIQYRRGLPARVTTPIRTYPIQTWCYSAMHFAKDTYAIDIMVGSGTPVYATTQDEKVISVAYDTGGWGNYVITNSKLFARGAYRNFFHVYAHLQRVDVTANQMLQPETQVGLSGNTGNSDVPHLHFQVHTYFNEDGTGILVPVDLSPMKGFTPNLDYPLRGTCGYIGDPLTEPLIMEANEFQFSSQPVSSGHYWNCSTFLPKHTGTCYRAAIPIDPQWGFDPINTNNKHLSPSISYMIWVPLSGSYRVWVCGMGGSVDDDSLHMGSMSTPKASADRITGYHSNQWIWQSTTTDGVYPSLALNSGYLTIDIWARENGMRIDRILLTQNHSFNPESASTSIRCGAEGLY